MRIATVCFSTSLGGLELATLRRAAELRDHGHHVVTILPDAAGTRPHAEAAGLRADIITPTVSYLDLPAARKLSAVFEREAIDVALVGRTRDLSTVMLGAGRSRGVVLYQQMQSGLDKHDWFHNRVYKRLDACITITRRGRDELATHTVLASEKIAVIPYGIDTARFAPGAVDRAAARAAYGIRDDAFAVGLIGRIDRGKGQPEFIEALGLAALRAPETAERMRGLVIGERPGDDPEYSAELHRIRDGLPIAERISFHPFADDPRTAFAALDLFVLASHAETFGMVVQEAMAMGIPVIGTDAGGVPEIIEHGTNGLLVPPKDAGALADAIVRVANDAALRASMAERGREFVLRTYDLERQYRAMEKVLEDAVAARKRF